MSTYYLYDGRNELGPFTIEQLRKQRLRRNTLIRQGDSDKWTPAEKIQELKDLVVPLKIKRPKDIIPVVGQQFTHLQKTKPKVLYGSLLSLALLAFFSIYSVNKTVAKELPKTLQQNLPQVAVASIVAPLAKPVELPKLAIEKPKHKPEDPARASRLRWKKLITATNSNYGIGLLGGIKDLTVIVSNKSDYPLDEAVIKITYIKANGAIWKSKLMSVFGVPANDSKEEPVADVGRGKKVKVSIQKLTSKKMNFQFIEGQSIINPEDPYRIQ